MEAIGRLAGGVAHDFNNLLQAITGYTNIVLEDLPPGSQMHSDLSQVKAAADRACEVTGQLLAFSRKQLMEQKDVDLNELVQSMMKLMPRLIGEDIEVVLIRGHDIGIVRADPSQLEQVLMNLCVNARDAMPGGGKLVIETENVLINGEYCAAHSGAREGRYVLMSVTDNGQGMDKETLAQIFEPFFTTKELGKGTGLGLSSVYGIVKQHGGKVQAYSEKGKGTTIKVYLPIVERTARAVGTKIEKRVEGGNETVLVAEDEDIVLSLCERILTQAGYRVIAARDGAEAKQAFDDHADEISLALLDVVMPEAGGRSVMEYIKAKRPEVRFLFASGYTENAIHTNFVLDQGVNLLRKPYAREELLRKVREVLEDERGPRSAPA